MSLHVMLIDDDETVIYLHKIIVKDSSLTKDPYCAYNGKQALEYLQQKQNTDPVHFLVLLDINMPIMNGWEFLDGIQQEDFAGKITVVMVTSSTDNADRKKARAYKQVIDFVEKPITNTDCEKIKEASALSSYFAS